MLPLCPFSSTRVTPAISRHTHAGGEPALRHFFLFRPRVFPRALGSVARREPARIPHAGLGPGRGPWHVSWGSKVASPFGEGFPTRGAIQVHANPRTQCINILKKCPTSNVISGILNVINVVRHYILGDGKIFPRHQHARHATTYIILNQHASLFLRKYFITNQPTTNPIASLICEINYD